MLTPGANGSPDRWYPTVTRLPDTKLLITGGYEDVAPIPAPIAAVETLDPNTGARTVFSDRSTTPASITNRDYTHVFVLPTTTSANDLLMIGEQSVAVEASTATPGRYTTMTGRPGYTGAAGLNWGTSSLMLPIRTTDNQWGYHNGAVMVASGNMGSAYQRRADIFDPITGAWKTSIDLQVNRHHPSSVNLPDGRVLLVNGHDLAGDPQVKQAQYIDPAQNFKVSLGSANEGVVRGYHSIALLLPDGRVLVGGGRDQSTDSTLEKPTFQFYLPDYLSEAPTGDQQRPDADELRRPGGHHHHRPAAQRGRAGRARFHDPLVRFEPAVRAASDRSQQHERQRGLTGDRGNSGEQPRGAPRVLHALRARREPGALGRQDRARRLTGRPTTREMERRATRPT